MAPGWSWTAPHPTAHILVCTPDSYLPTRTRPESLAEHSARADSLVFSIINHLHKTHAVLFGSNPTFAFRNKPLKTPKQMITGMTLLTSIIQPMYFTLFTCWFMSKSLRLGCTVETGLVKIIANLKRWIMLSFSIASGVVCCCIILRHES